MVFVIDVGFMMFIILGVLLLIVVFVSVVYIWLRLCLFMKMEFELLYLESLVSGMFFFVRKLEVMVVKLRVLKVWFGVMVFVGGVLIICICCVFRERFKSKFKIVSLKWGG